MAKITKEQQAYMDGMLRARNIVVSGGLEALGREISFRGIHSTPNHSTPEELIACGRGYAKEELMIVSTALASTLSYDMNLPPSVLKKFLKHFNENVTTFRYDAEKYEAAQMRLNKDSIMNDMCKNFMEDKEDE